MNGVGLAPWKGGRGGVRIFATGNPAFPSEEGGRCRLGLTWTHHFQILFISVPPQAGQPPGVSPGHSTPREADLTFQELTGMPSSPNKYHTPLCSV